MYKCIGFKSGFGNLYASTNLAITRMLRGMFGIYMPGSRKALEQLSWMCKGCLLQRDLFYSSNLGLTYTKLSAHIMFSSVSMDPLMPISVLPWQGSKEPVKKIPVIVKCLTWGSIYLTVAESQATNQMLLVLLRLEQTFGQLELISRDRGKDLLIDKDTQ